MSDRTFRLARRDCAWSLVPLSDPRSASEIRDCCLRHRTTKKSEVVEDDAEITSPRDLLDACAE